MPKEKAQNPEEGARNFARFLSVVDDGFFHDECSALFHDMNVELGKRARQDGKAKGQFTVTFKITHERNGVVEVVPDLAAKLPKRPQGKSVFFATPGGNLTEKNPKQLDLPVREVPDRDDAEEAREVATTRAVKEA